MKRFIDLLFVFCLMGPAIVLFAVLAVVVKSTSRGPILHWSSRVGCGNRIFRMPKLRTMRIDAPQLASHLLPEPDRWITPVGALLRKTSLDELPQLWSIFVGHMSFVGPRPALFNQQDLILHRTQAGVHRLRPGLTGWAQIHGRDQLSVVQKTHLDAFYLDNRSLWLDLTILGATFLKVARCEGVAEGDTQYAHPEKAEGRKAA